MPTITQPEKHRTRKGGETTYFYTVITNLEEGINNPRGNHFSSLAEAQEFINNKVSQGYTKY